MPRKTMSHNQLSILLPTHNNVCVQLVRDLQKQASLIQDFRYEILVADDGSTDSESISKNRAINDLPYCRFIERKHNVGRASIRNYLANEAQYERLLFIDSDLHVCSDFFINRYIQEEGEIIAGGLKKGGDAQKLANNLRYVYEKAYERKHDYIRRNKKPDKDFTAACCLISKAVIRQCPFNEKFKEYGYEDALLGKCFSAHGHKIVHIDNPILMNDYEYNELYLKKTEEACRTLYKFREELQGYSKLIYWQEKLSQWHTSYLLHKLYKHCGAQIRKRLVDGKPSLLLFNTYKLLYYIHLNYDQSPLISSLK